MPALSIQSSIQGQQMSSTCVVPTMCTFAGNFCLSSVFWHLRHRSAPSFLLNTQILYHIHEESRIQIWSNVHRRHFSRFFSLLLCSLRRPTRSQITMYLDLHDSVFGLTNISIFHPKYFHISIKHMSMFQSKICPYLNKKYFHIVIQNISIFRSKICPHLDLKDFHI